MNEITIDQIQSGCQTYALARERLSRKASAVERERRKILEASRKELRDLAQAASDARLALEKQLSAGRPLFTKPKTQVYHGILVGFEKQRDTVTYPDDALIIQRIETMLKAKAAGLVETTKRLIKDAFKRLPRPELQMLGCQFTTGADKPVVRPQADQDVESLVTSYLAEAATDAEPEKAEAA